MSSLDNARGIGHNKNTGPRIVGRCFEKVLYENDSYSRDLLPAISDGVCPNIRFNDRVKCGWS